MADTQFTPQQMEKLLQYASQRLGSTPEQLKSLLEGKGTEALPPEAAAKAQELMENKEKAAQLLNDSRIRQLLQQLLG